MFVLTKQHFIFIYLLLLSTKVLAAQEILLFSYIKHPQIESKIIPLLTSVYQRLGYQVEFVAMPVDRGEASVKSGLVDGAVVRFVSSIDNFDHVVLVKPALVDVTTHLICAEGVVCDKSVLSDASAVILVPNSILKKGIFIGESKNIKAQLYLLDNMDIYFKMLKNGRMKYAIYHADDGQLPPIFKFNFNEVLLKKTKGFHVLNKKHQHLLPQLAIEIKKQLDKLNASSNHHNR